jgi:hypothetical protein
MLNTGKLDVLSDPWLTDTCQSRKCKTKKCQHLKELNHMITRLKITPVSTVGLKPVLKAPSKQMRTIMIDQELGPFNRASWMDIMLL